jgi:uncharacterized membrane protein (UPF0136 family)
MLFATALIGFVVRSEFMPQRHYVYFDEHANIEAARMLKIHGVFGMCVNGALNECHLAKVFTNPAGYHVMLALWFQLVGCSERSAFVFSAFIGSLSIAAIGLLAYSIFGSAAGSVFSSLLLCFLPLHLKYSAATNLNIVSFLFLILFFITLNQALKSKLRIDVCLNVATALFFINIRGENWIIATAVYLATLLIYSHRMRSYRFRKSDAAIALTALIAVVPVYFLTVFIMSIGKPGWNVTMPTVSTLLINQLPNNLAFWFSSHSPFMLALLCLSGMLFYGVKNNYRLPLLWALFFLLLLFGYSSYDYGKFNSFENDRFSMPLYLPMVLWGGYGLRRIAELRGILALCVAALLTAFSYGHTLNKLMSMSHPWMDGLHESTQIIVDNYPKLPIVTNISHYYTVIPSRNPVFVLSGMYNIKADAGAIFIHDQSFLLSSENKSVFKLKVHRDHISRLPEEAVFAFNYAVNFEAIATLLNYLNLLYTFEECRKIDTEYLTIPICRIKLRPKFITSHENEHPQSGPSIQSDFK